MICVLYGLILAMLIAKGIEIVIEWGANYRG